MTQCAIYSSPVTSIRRLLRKLCKVLSFHIYRFHFFETIYKFRIFTHRYTLISEIIKNGLIFSYVKVCTPLSEIISNCSHLYTSIHIYFLKWFKMAVPFHIQAFPFHFMKVFKMVSFLRTYTYLCDKMT